MVKGMITICSVSNEYDNTYLNLNYELVEKTNVDFKWLVAINNCMRNNRVKGVKALRDEFVRCPGISHGDAERKARKLGRKFFSPCTQHGLSLNNCLQLVKTKLILILDPDFYIIPPIDYIFDRMIQKDLCMFGASYHFKNKLIRDFPTAFCLFINTDKLDVDFKLLDFTPGYGETQNFNHYPDVGYKVYSKYKDSDIIKYDFMKPALIPNPYLRNADKIKYSVSLTNVKYKYEIDFSISTHINPDEYFYDDKLYGLHLRSRMYNLGKNQRIGRQKSLSESMLSHVNVIRKAIDIIRKHDNYMFCN
jgi:hypothetical protein